MKQIGLMGYATLHETAVLAAHNTQQGTQQALCNSTRAVVAAQKQVLCLGCAWEDHRHSIGTRLRHSHGRQSR